MTAEEREALRKHFECYVSGPAYDVLRLLAETETMIAEIERLELALYKERYEVVPMERKRVRDLEAALAESDKRAPVWDRLEELAHRVLDIAAKADAKGAPTQCAVDKDGTVLAVGTSLDDVILKVEAAGVKDKVYAYDLHPRPKQAPEPARRHAFIARHGTSPIESVCQWQSEEYGVDASLPPVIGRKICSNTATHTTCDPVGAVVCATHKCRCSKPLKVTCDACKTLYVPGERHGCVAKPSTEEDTKP